MIKRGTIRSGTIEKIAVGQSSAEGEQEMSGLMSDAALGGRESRRSVFSPALEMCTSTAIAILFFVILTPIGLCTRLTGHNPLRLRFEPTASSYWIRRSLRGGGQISMLKQF